MGTKLSDLSVGTGLAPTDLMYLVDDSESDTAQKGKQITLKELAKALSPELRIIYYGIQGITIPTGAIFTPYVPNEAGSRNPGPIEFGADFITLPAGKKYALTWVPGQDPNNHEPEAYAEIRTADESDPYSSPTEWGEGHVDQEDFNWQHVLFETVDLTDRDPGTADQGKKVAVGMRGISSAIAAQTLFYSPHFLMIQEFGL